MSSAHRPTWDPAKGRADDRHKSARVGARQLPAHTKLKFRSAPQPTLDAASVDARNDASGSSSVRSISDRANDEVAVNRRRDLKRELEWAERIAQRKRGRADVDGQNDEPAAEADEEGRRRTIVAEIQSLDRPDLISTRQDNGTDVKEGQPHSDALPGDSGGGSIADAHDTDSDESSDDEDDEDETLALMRELEKIKRERAEEKARQEEQRQGQEEATREEEIAMGNPLLRLEYALRNGNGDQGSDQSIATSTRPTNANLQVKRRWDDDTIFKNQAVTSSNGQGGSFINDLTRSEFHKRFMQRYIR